MGLKQLQSDLSEVEYARYLSELIQGGLQGEFWEAVEEEINRLYTEATELLEALEITDPVAIWQARAVWSALPKIKRSLLYRVEQAEELIVEQTKEKARQKRKGEK